MPAKTPFDNLGHITCQEDLDALGELSVQASLDLYFATALEVGSWVGSSALVLANWFNRVFCVDHFMGNQHDCLRETAFDAKRRYGPDAIFETFCKNIGDDLFTTVFPLVGTSLQWSRTPWPFKLDLVFLDGEHDISSVYGDIEIWLPHVKPGGILCGHDYGYFGVTDVVDRKFPQRQIAGKSVWWVTVP